MLTNGHTSGDEREVWMERVNFDGHITGETARALIRVAKSEGRTPQDLLQSYLRTALAEATDGATNVEDDVKAEPMTINAGNGGFHVVTVVADGYGYAVAEDTLGAEVARVRIPRANPEADSTVVDARKALHDLMDAFSDAEEKRGAQV